MSRERNPRSITVAHGAHDAVPDGERRWRPPFELDLGLTLSALAHGKGDPAVRFVGGEIWRATRTPDGPATLRIRRDRADVAATAWGPGAAWALDSLPALLGAADEPRELAPRHPLVRELVHRFRGLRLIRTLRLVEALLPAVLEQKVTGDEARLAYRRLLWRYGERAPGPFPLHLPPPPERLARLPSFALHPLGVERRRAETLRRVGTVAARLEDAIDLPPAEADRRLRAVPGIGAWTSAEARRIACGDPDAVSVGDYHVPSLVSWALAGEPRADDARMLELLDAYRGQRARVVRLLELSGKWAPRFGPRLAPRRFETI